MVIFHSYVSLPEGTRPMGVPVSAMLEWPGAIYDACRHRPLMSRWLRPDRRGQDGMNRWDRMNRIDHIWHNNIREYSRVGYVYIYIFGTSTHARTADIFKFFFSGDLFCLCQGENPPGPPTPWVSNLSGAKSRRAALGNYHSFMVSSFLFAVVTGHLFHKTSINMYDNAWWYIVHKHDGMSRYNYHKCHDWFKGKSTGSLGHPFAKPMGFWSAAPWGIIFTKHPMMAMRQLKR